MKRGRGAWVLWVLVGCNPSVTLLPPGDAASGDASTELGSDARGDDRPTPDVGTPPVDVPTPDVPAPTDVPTDVPTDAPIAVDAPIAPDVVALDAPSTDIPDVPSTDVPVAPVDAAADAGSPSACGPEGLPSCAPSASTATADLLVQDVCATPAGVLLPDDPYDPCPAGSARRDLRVGEALPYHRHDQPSTGRPSGTQRRDSFPRTGAGARVINTYDFEPFGEYNPTQDGYSVAEVDGAMASLVGARDMAGGTQTFFGSGCALDDAWLLLPTSAAVTAGSQVATLRAVGWERAAQTFPGACPASYDRAYTSWSRRAVTFGGVGGAREKRLDSVVSDHGTAATLEASEYVERAYFTTVYGLTRWELWRRGASVTPRTEGCNGEVVDGDLRRVDCHDWTHVLADPLPYPPGVWPTSYADANLLRSGSFGEGDLRGWSRLGMSTTGGVTNWSYIGGATGGHLATNCNGPCSDDQAIYQDVPRNGVTGQLAFGGTFWTTEGTGSIELVVFQRDAAAAIVARNGFVIDVTTTPRRAASLVVPLDARATQFRYTIYLRAPGTVRADDLWLNRVAP